METPTPDSFIRSRAALEAVAGMSAGGRAVIEFVCLAFCGGAYRGTPLQTQSLSRGELLCPQPMARAGGLCCAMGLYDSPRRSCVAVGGGVMHLCGLSEEPKLERRFGRVIGSTSAGSTVGQAAGDAGSAAA